MVIEHTENCFKTHCKYLEGIGMIVNRSKTKLLYSSRTKQNQLVMNTENENITSQKTMKALGIMITDDLSWNEHVGYAINKSRYAIRKIKFVKRWIDSQDALKLVTSQYHSILFYGGLIWLNSLS